MPDALEAATHLIQELCGGEASEVVSAGAAPHWQRSATLHFARLESLGGVAVPQDEAVDSLSRLGFEVEKRTAEMVQVAVPSWRNDIAAPIHLDQAATLPVERARKAAEGCAEVEPEADLVEEVLRLRGLDTIPPVSMPRAEPVPVPTLTPRQVRAAVARRTLAAAGLLECVTFSFMDGRVAAAFGGDDPALRVLNPIASDLDQMRPTPVATLALAAGRNAARGLPDAALFEVGPTFSSGSQETVAAGLFAGHTERHPLAPARPFAAMDAKAAASDVLEALGLPSDSLSVTTDAPAWYHPGRSGVIRQGPKLALATFGELHPSVLAALDLSGPAAAFEVFLDRIPEPKRRKRAAPDLPPFQPVRRDFAFLVPQDMPADIVLRAARGAERSLITSAALFDVYTGDKLPPGQKSVGVEVVLQPRERTLTDAEIEAAAAKIVAAVTKRTGGALR
jgi:phenylalanyl-tRNA synthetase beta chain